MERRYISLVSLGIVAVATPATIALSLGLLTGDQRYRPLSLVEDGLGELTAADEPLHVQVLLHWAPADGQRDAALTLGRHIKGTFSAKGYDAWIAVVEDPDATTSYIVYEVGRNQIGPFTIANAARGVRPAIAALRALKSTYPELVPPDA